ncbi:MAG: ABC transporter permease [Anaerolineae bacterium]|nr:ABC transporter permease [Anaerolineae bacterium]
MSETELPTPVERSMMQQAQSQSLADYARAYGRRLRSGDLGAIPIILGLVVITIIFQNLNENFLTPRNMVNLIVQMAGITVIAIGVVFVLLLGEIDLSIGYVSAVAAVLVALLLRGPTGISGVGRLMERVGITEPFNWWMAVGLALLLVALIGMVQGLIITRFQLPSFVVTLAGLLVWNGVVLILIGAGGTVIIQDQIIVNIANYFLPKELVMNGATLPVNISWLVGLTIVVIFAAGRVSRWVSRRKRGVSTTPVVIIVLEILLVTLVTAVIIHICNLDRGVPLVGIIMLILLVFFSFLATRTRFGRYVYAIGGNMEAARRAGINVTRIRVTVFMLSSMMAGMGGIVLASRLRSVDTAAGGGDLLLISIAAPVIGGTSLFGGRGRVISALLGALVIAGVNNGMGLLGLSAGVKFVVTGLVLLAAVLVDAISRRGRTQSGIA